MLFCVLGLGHFRGRILKQESDRTAGVPRLAPEDGLQWGQSSRSVRPPTRDPVACWVSFRLCLRSRCEVATQRIWGATRDHIKTRHGCAEGLDAK